MKRILKKTLTPLLALTMALSLGTLGKKVADNEITTKAASLSWVVANQTMPTNLPTPATYSMNSNWDITFVKNAANAVGFYPPSIRMYSHRQTGNGNDFLVGPSATNTTQLMTEISITRSNTSAAKLTVWAGDTVAGLTQLATPTFSNNVYTYTNSSFIWI